MNKIHKLYLFEGLNEHAVTSLALDVKERLIKEGRNVKLFSEGMSHPADMALHAYLSMEEYNEFLYDVLAIWNYDKCCTKEELMDCILSETHFEDNHAIIAYKQIAFPSSKYEPLLADLAAREVYDGRLSYGEFKALHQRRFKQFSKEALNTPNTVFLFQNTLFKNHINELMGFYDMEDEMILTHLKDLVSQVLSLNPILTYLTPEPLYDFVAAEKEAGNTSLLSSATGSNYGRLHGLQGIHGTCTYLANRIRIEQLALDRLSLEFPELCVQCLDLGMSPVTPK